ncbi:GGDEF domain-containing protein [Salipiger sp. PrR002]|uniref:GGDEF domain-containing protein n=1 Tax=Salipiger sp. PrR002 TaxID=2706489 RepID=UPI001F1FFD7F|nr:GGDEF domain-containing protein [Salipiger sp. PrR002]
MMELSLPQTTLDALCPMHLRLDASGRIVALGPTLRRVLRGGTERMGADFSGQHFSSILEIFRPRRITDITQLHAASGRKLHLRFTGRAEERRGSLRGLALPDTGGGAVLNLSFGIGVVEAVRDHALTSSDFAPTDLAIDMLYLVEAKSAAMEASRTLNRRLQGAMLAAEQRAFTDPLTGLRNRRAVTHALAELLRRDAEFALMHVDLDFFKQVNDTLGHGAGDRVLQQVARIMLELTRRDDTVARVGGDEFIIIFVGLTDAERLSDLAEHLIRRLEAPVALGEDRAQISASIGIAANGEAARYGSAGALLEDSDTALYAAKRAGRGQHAFFRRPPEGATRGHGNALRGAPERDPGRDGPKPEGRDGVAAR